MLQRTLTTATGFGLGLVNPFALSCLDFSSFVHFSLSLSSAWQARQSHRPVPLASFQRVRRFLEEGAGSGNLVDLGWQLLVGLIDWIGLDCIDFIDSFDWIGLDWIALVDWIGLDWIGLDWVGLGWIGLDWVGLI